MSKARIVLSYFLLERSRMFQTWCHRVSNQEPSIHVENKLNTHSMQCQNSVISCLFKHTGNSSECMNHTATVMSGLQTWGFNKSDKDERIKALETSVDTINEKLRVLMSADEMNVEVLKENNLAIGKHIREANNKTLAQLQGVANDLARLRAWKEDLLARHPELRTTTEPASTTRAPWRNRGR